MDSFLAALFSSAALLMTLTLGGKLTIGFLPPDLIAGSDTLLDTPLPLLPLEMSEEALGDLGDLGLPPELEDCTECMEMREETERVGDRSRCWNLDLGG